MNKKIYNNLSVGNLVKTKWFNQFNEDQQEQIRYGLEANLDVSIYAKKEFNWDQMWQIRLGLKENLNVSLYAKKDFNYKEMKEIRLKLLEESTL